jgi:hypothetical protein
VHLSALQLLSERLTDENHAELLDAASGKTKREVEHLLAARFPRPDVRSSLRKRPERRGARTTSGDDATLPSQTDLSSTSAREPRPRVEPLSASRYKLQLPISEARRDQLELARDLMSPQNPARELEPILDRALDLLIADLEKRKIAKVRAAATHAARRQGRVEERPRGCATRDLRARRLAMHVRLPRRPPLHVSRFPRARPRRPAGSGRWQRGR